MTMELTCISWIELLPGFKSLCTVLVSSSAGLAEKTAAIAVIHQVKPMVPIKGKKEEEKKMS